MKDTLSART